MVDVACEFLQTSANFSGQLHHGRTRRRMENSNKCLVRFGQSIPVDYLKFLVGIGVGDNRPCGRHNNCK
jgi:hypothetical protein